MTRYNVKVYFSGEEGFVQLINMTKDLLMSYIDYMGDSINCMYITQVVDNRACKHWKYSSKDGAFIKI